MMNAETIEQRIATQHEAGQAKRRTRYRQLVQQAGIGTELSDADVAELADLSASLGVSAAQRAKDIREIEAAREGRHRPVAYLLWDRTDRSIALSAQVDEAKSGGAVNGTGTGYSTDAPHPRFRTSDEVTRDVDKAKAARIEALELLDKIEKALPADVTVFRLGRRELARETAAIGINPDDYTFKPAKHQPADEFAELLRGLLDVCAYRDDPTRTVKPDRPAA